jgi:hypothetical protein
MDWKIVLNVYKIQEGHGEERRGEERRRKRRRRGRGEIFKNLEELLRVK